MCSFFRQIPLGIGFSCFNIGAGDGWRSIIVFGLGSMFFVAHESKAGSTQQKKRKKTKKKQPKKRKDKEGMLVFIMSDVTRYYEAGILFNVFCSGLISPAMLLAFWFSQFALYYTSAICFVFDC